MTQDYCMEVTFEREINHTERVERQETWDVAGYHCVELRGDRTVD